LPAQAARLTLRMSPDERIAAHPQALRLMLALSPEVQERQGPQ
jgi:hypothetical protein